MRIRKTKEAKSGFSHQQNRGQGIKDLWIGSLHYHIENESSTLTFLPRDNALEVVEHLNHVRCWMQDKLFPSTENKGPTQQIRYMKAKDATYLYHYNQFLTNGVLVSMYRADGHQLQTTFSQDNVFLRGSASEASFSISDNTPEFFAQNFRAQIHE